MEGSRHRHSSDSRHALVCDRFELLGPPHHDEGIEWCDALDTIEQRRVVLKSTSTSGAGDGPGRSRLVHEFAFLSTASHPSIPRALDFVTDNSGRSHVSLEDNDGFIQLLKWAESGPSLDEFIPWFDSLLSVLEYLHGLGLVHTDLGPATVLVSDRGPGRPTSSIRLTGFHRSLWYAAGSATPRKRREFFLPSEGGQPSARGPRVDLYSAAALAACVLRGVGEGEVEDLQSPDALLCGAGDRIPEPLSAVLKRMTASDDSLRPSSVYDVRRQLDDTPFRGPGSGALTVRSDRECGIAPRAALTSVLSAGCNEVSIRGAHMVVLVGAGGSGKTTLGKQLRVESLIRGYDYSICTEAVGRSGTTCLSDSFRFLSSAIARSESTPARVCPSGKDSRDRQRSVQRGGTGTSSSRIVCFADNIDRLADDDLDSLLELARAATHAPDSALIVATCREVPVALLHGEAVRLRGEVRSTGGAGSSELAVDVRPLSMFTLDEMERFVADMMCARPTGDLASWILRRSGGNPLFAQGLVRYLAKQDCLLRTPEGLAMMAGCGADLGVPRSLTAALEDRLRALSDDEMHLAGVVSLGPGVTPEVVSGVTHLTAEKASDVLGRLTEAGLLGTTVGGGDVTFTHGLLRDAVYDRLPGARRESLHRSVAEIWDDAAPGECAPSHREDVLAWHLSRSDRPGEAAVHAVRGAAMLAAEGQAEDSVRCLRIAEELRDGGSAWEPDPDTLLRLAEAYWRLGRAPYCARACRLGLADADSLPSVSPAVLMDLNWLYGRSIALSGDLGTAAERFQRAAEIARETRDASRLAKAYSGLCMISQMAGDFAEVDRLADEGLALLEGTDVPLLAAVCGNAKGNALQARCEWRAAIDWFARSEQAVPEGGDRIRAATNRCNIGLAHMFLGEWNEAERCFEEAMAAGLECGDAYTIELASMNSGTLWLRRGALDEAAKRYREAEKCGEACGDGWGLAATLSNMGELEHLRGDDLAAQRLYSRSHQLMEKTGCIDDLPELLRRMAESLSAMGLHDESRARVTSGYSMAEDMGCRLEAASCLRVLAESTAGLGDFKQARDQCGTAIDSLRLLGASYELGQALSALGRIEVASGHPDAAVRHFEESRAVFLRLGARRDARALQEQLAEMAGAVSYPTPELPGERERLAALYRSSQSLAAVAPIEDLIREAADAVAAEILADTAAVVLVDPTRPACVALSTMSETDESPENLISLVSVLLAQLPRRRCTASQLSPDEASASLAPLLSSRGIRHLLIVPMVSGAHLLGALYLDYRRRDGHFSEEDIRFAEALAAQAASAIENAQLREKLKEEIELLRWEVDARHSFANIIGQSLEMQQLFTLLEKVSRTSVTVLIEGESGTGKELVARAIHSNGPRKKERFVAQNCAALPEQLLESELFGHVRGAFTGALRDKPGLFEAADGGTFFLDEIADMPQSLQVKLLRVLQDGEIRRVGATDPISVDVRIIAATNKVLEEEVKEGRFREDIFYRLNVVRVDMPPLRVRRDDIPLLAQHFLNQFTEKSGQSEAAFSERAMELLVNYDWPGNVRELENEIERAVALSEPGAPITASALSERIRSVAVAIKPPKPGTKLSLKDMVEDVEKRVILQMLRENNWNKSRTAVALGLSRQGLLKKIARFGLKPDEE